jgi:hypothetical protein
MSLWGKNLMSGSRKGGNIAKLKGREKKQGQLKLKELKGRNI